MADSTASVTVRFGADVFTENFSRQSRISRVLHAAERRLDVGGAGDELLLCTPDGRPLHPLQRLCDIPAADAGTLVLRRRGPGDGTGVLRPG